MTPPPDLQPERPGTGAPHDPAGIAPLEHALRLAEALVFASDRAGRFELWWARLDQPATLRPIEGVRPDTRQPPAWSADGRRLLVTALDDMNAPMILEVEPRSGRIERLPVPGECAGSA